LTKPFLCAISSPTHIHESRDRDQVSRLHHCFAEVAGVTFSDSNSALVPTFLNQGPDQGPSILQILESDSCSDSGYNHRSNGNLPMLLHKKWPHRLLLLPKWRSDSGSGSGFS